MNHLEKRLLAVVAFLPLLASCGGSSSSSSKEESKSAPSSFKEAFLLSQGAVLAKGRVSQKQVLTAKDSSSTTEWSGQSTFTSRFNDGGYYLHSEGDGLGVSNKEDETIYRGAYGVACKMALRRNNTIKTEVLRDSVTSMPLDFDASYSNPLAALDFENDLTSEDGVTYSYLSGSEKDEAAEGQRLMKRFFGASVAVNFKEITFSYQNAVFAVHLLSEATDLSSTLDPDSSYGSCFSTIEMNFTLDFKKEDNPAFVSPAVLPATKESKKLQNALDSLSKADASYAITFTGNLDSYDAYSEKMGTLFTGEALVTPTRYELYGTPKDGSRTLDSVVFQQENDLGKKRIYQVLKDASGYLYLEDDPIRIYEKDEDGNYLTENDAAAFHEGEAINEVAPKVDVAAVFFTYDSVQDLYSYQGEYAPYFYASLDPFATSFLEECPLDSIEVKLDASGALKEIKLFASKPITLSGSEVTLEEKAVFSSSPTPSFDLTTLKKSIYVRYYFDGVYSYTSEKENEDGTTTSTPIVIRIDGGVVTFSSNGVQEEPVTGHVSRVALPMNGAIVDVTQFYFVRNSAKWFIANLSGNKMLLKDGDTGTGYNIVRTALD
jgi:hypothetical protein